MNYRPAAVDMMGEINESVNSNLNPYDWEVSQRTDVKTLSGSDNRRWTSTMTVQPKRYGRDKMIKLIENAINHVRI